MIFKVVVVALPSATRFLIIFVLSEISGSTEFIVLFSVTTI